MLAGAFTRRIYLEDDTGGIGAYLQRGDYPALALGDRVQITGWLVDYHGEAQIEVNGPDRIAWLGRAAPIIGRPIRTGEAGERYEGRLVWVYGRAIGFAGQSITVDDGSGAVRSTSRMA